MTTAYNRYNPSCVLITGATGDFGKAFAHRFAALGAALILHGRDAAKVDKLISELRADYPQLAAHPVVFDITDRAAMQKSIDDLPPAFRNTDLLINNAGGALGLDKAYEADMDDWDMMIDTNAKSLARMTRFVLPGMVERKRGHVINIGSIAGNYAYPNGNVYCAVKAFVKHFSMTLRADLVGTKVRVTNIEPGMVETQFSLARFKGDKQKADAVYANTDPLYADDIAEAVEWVATLPPHVNINRLEVMPTAQSFGPLTVERHAAGK